MKILPPDPGPWQLPHTGRVPRVDLISAEPHMPHVLVEKGDMTAGEFEQHLKGKTEFIKGMKKDCGAERKVSVTEGESGVAGLGWHWGLGLHWTNGGSEPGRRGLA